MNAGATPLIHWVGFLLRVWVYAGITRPALSSSMADSVSGRASSAVTAALVGVRGRRGLDLYRSGPETLEVKWRPRSNARRPDSLPVDTRAHHGSTDGDRWGCNEPEPRSQL